VSGNLHRAATRARRVQRKCTPTSSGPSKFQFNWFLASNAMMSPVRTPSSGFRRYTPTPPVCVIYFEGNNPYNRATVSSVMLISDALVGIYDCINPVSEVLTSPEPTLQTTMNGNVVPNYKPQF
jgi:hypothetical protein